MGALNLVPPFSARAGGQCSSPAPRRLASPEVRSWSLPLLPRDSDSTAGRGTNPAASWLSLLREVLGASAVSGGAWALSSVTRMLAEQVA